VFQDIDSVSLAGGAVTALVAGKLLLSAKYPRTWLLVCRHSSAFWRYVLYYGFLGTMVLGVIFRTDVGKIPVIAGIPRLIFWPIIVALVGTFAKFSFVGAVSDAHHFHMTARAMLFLFEPPLLEQIEKDEYFALKRIMRRHESRWLDLGLVKATMKRNIPDRIENSDRLVFLDELQKETEVDEAMISYYRFAGRSGFLFVFVEPALTPVAASSSSDVPLHRSPVDVVSRRKQAR